MTPTEIKKWRTSRNLTLDSLSRLLGVSVKTVQNWEAKKGLASHRKIQHSIIVHIRLLELLLDCGWTVEMLLKKFTLTKTERENDC